MSAGDDWRQTFRPDIPSPARMYNYFLGGKDHYEADRPGHRGHSRGAGVRPGEPGDLIRALVRPLVPGSYLAVSHATSDSRPAGAAAVERIYRATTTNIHARTRSEVLALVPGGLELIEPGLVWAPLWRPELGDVTAGSPAADDPAAANVYAVVACKS